MRMFLLGALCMYLVSSVIAVILDETGIVDYWSFGEVYFQVWLLPIVIPIALVQNVFKYARRYKASLLWYLIRHGVNPIGKTKQLDKLSKKELLYIQKNTPSNSAIHFYATKLLDKGDGE